MLGWSLGEAHWGFVVLLLLVSCGAFEKESNCCILKERNYLTKSYILISEDYKSGVSHPSLSPRLHCYLLVDKFSACIYIFSPFLVLLPWFVLYTSCIQVLCLIKVLLLTKKNNSKFHSLWEEVLFNMLYFSFWARL